MDEQLLSVRDLRVHFDLDSGTVPAVDGVSFTLGRGKTLGIVGESGCGKSITSLAVMGLVPKPAGRIVSGSILFNGENLLGKNENEMRAIRGNRLSMVFQEPMTSLNPVFTIGEQIVEAIVAHDRTGKAEARRRAVGLLQTVGIPSAERRLDEYPHQLSGGMRQRVMIAMALACKPSLLIADEPTTALDVTIQAQILDLMRRLRDEFGMSIMLITHDMGVIAEMADDVVVMYAGKIVEQADVKTLFAEPRHPYTIGLLDSIPRLHHKVQRLPSIEGVVPNPFEMPSGCRFHTRCGSRGAACETAEPPLAPASPVNDTHRVACWECSGYRTEK